MPPEKDLRDVVIDALNLHAAPPFPLPDLSARLGKPKRRLVAGSGNAFATGKILFADEDAVFADEGQYRQTLRRAEQLGIDGAVVVSASGEKDAPEIVEYLRENFPKMPTHLLTCAGDSTAATALREHQGKDHVILTPRNPEPITYNTSTYLGMVLAKTHEEAGAILRHIETEVAPRIPDDRTQDLGRHSAFYLIVEPKFELVREMFVTKFDELFGPMVKGRCYTWRQTRHAKTLVPSDKELFINLGCKYRNEEFGHEDARLHIPVPEWAGYAAMIAIGYYVIGRIQAQFPAWFKENADSYRAWQDQQYRNRWSKQPCSRSGASPKLVSQIKERS